MLKDQFSVSLISTENIENNISNDIINSNTVSYGCFKNKILIQIMTFNLIEEDFQWELTSNYSLQNNSVDNSILLFQKFLKDNNPYDVLYKCGNEEENNWLYDCGFNVIKDSIYSWFCGGCVYRMEIIGTDKFYIGCTTQNIDNYWGSGHSWNKYIDNNNITRDSNHIKKIILKDSKKDIINSRKELFKLEYEEISKFCENNKIKEQYQHKMLNEFIGEQWPGIVICSECLGKNGWHKQFCSRYEEIYRCPECGEMRGRHKDNCSHIIICEECGGLDGRHKKNCLKVNHCPECGLTHGHHAKECSHYLVCPECESMRSHKKGCSYYKEKSVCNECGKKGGKHSKDCSRLDKSKICSECGGINGNHKSYCSKKKTTICPECNGKQGNHYKYCSHYKKRIPCPECGNTGTKHKATCSKYKPSKPCLECGRLSTLHEKWCSKYKNAPDCTECGGKSGHHKSTCSLRKEIPSCSECGGKSEKHYKTCSKYKKPDPCSECGKMYGHKSFCSKSKKCEECGHIPHLKICSKHKPIKSCPECNGIDGKHRKTCSKYKIPENCCEFCGTPPGGRHKKECPNNK